MTTDVIEEEKPKLLKAVELVVSNPEDIKRETEQLLTKYQKANSDKTDKEVQDLVAEKVISNYSYFAAFSGGTTSLTGIIPGLGTAVAVGGGAGADAIACMKFQIEMTMALATVYGHDILIEEEKRLCYLIAGLGAISQAAKESGKTTTTKAFTKLVETHLKGPLLVAVKEVFKKLGYTFTRSALVKAIPFGVGVVIGFSVNKGLTWYVGSKAKDFFKADA